MLVLSRSLDTRLRRVREKSSRKTKKDLGANEAAVRAVASTTTVVDEEAKSDHKQASTKDDEGLQLADAKDDKAEEDTRYCGGEAV